MTESNQSHVTGNGDQAQSRSEKWGVVFLCHGSQRGTSPAECSCSWNNGTGDLPSWCRHCPSTPEGLGKAAQKLQSILTDDQASVLLSCLEFIEPHPEQAVRQLAGQGLEQIVVIPYLLGHGKHATLEMDEVLDDVRAQNPEVEVCLTEGLGSDPRLADLILERIRDLGSGAELQGSVDEKVGILLVKAGTRTQYDDCQWFEELAQMVENRLGSGYTVAFAQSHYGDPTMDAAGELLVKEHGVSSIVCVPYIFFPGMILSRNVLGGMDSLQERYPDIRMSVTPPLGVDNRLLAVAADRVQEAWGKQAPGRGS